jgi:hypothetical protein
MIASTLERRIVLTGVSLSVPLTTICISYGEATIRKESNAGSQCSAPSVATAQVFAHITGSVLLITPR